MLIVLDNAYPAAQVRPLLPGAPGSLVVVTSRNRLAGLLAYDGARRIELDVLTAREARTLLARLLGPDRVRAESAAVSDLATACACLPLALRIAAANLNNHHHRCGVAGYVADLRGGSRLTALAADGDDQAAVRTTFDLSYDVLPAPARRLFRLLSQVPGPDVTVPATAALVDSAPDQAGRWLDELAAAHLIVEHEPHRYAFHDLLRLYATERCEAEDGPVPRAAALRRLLDWYLFTLDGVARLLYPEAVRLPLQPCPPSIRPVGFSTSGEALAWLSAELPNLVAAVRHGAAHGPRRSAWLLADVLRYHFILRGYAVDWRTVADAGLAAAEAEGAGDAQAAAYLSLANSHHFQSQHAPAVADYERALAFARQVGWLECESAVLNGLGTVYWSSGRLREATDHFTRSLALDERAGRRVGQAISLSNLATLYQELGLVTEAADHHRRALRLHRQLGSRSGESNTLVSLGSLAHHTGRLDAALGHFTEALAIQREIGDRVGEADTLRMLAMMQLDTGNHRQALQSAQAAAALSRDVGERQIEAGALTSLGAVLCALGRDREALGEFERALSIAHEIGERFVEAEALTGLAGAEHHLGRPDRALACAARANEITRQCGYRVLEGHALSRLAAIHLALGARDRATALAEQALDVHRETGHRLGEARILDLLDRAPPRDPDAARR
jgi:tetratricopeptide (TPR) repeat protein